MKSKVVITLSAVCQDPELEKRLLNAVEDEDIKTVLELFDYCEDETCHVSLKQYKPVDIQ